MAQLCLKWNNHEQSVIQCLYEQYEQEIAVDVTLACEGQQLKAHKCILMSCSPYFHLLLSSNPCKHPIIILKDVRFADLKALIEFMYRGEVTVGHDQLPSLLKTATTLQVKQLDEMESRHTYGTEQTVQSARSRKRKRGRQRGVSGGQGTRTDNESDASGDEIVVKQQMGSSFDVESGTVIEGGDGQQMIQVTDGNGHGSSRILELSMAEVVGNEASEEVTSDNVDPNGQVVTEGNLALVSGTLSGSEHDGTLMSLMPQDDSQIMVFRKKQSFVWEYFCETGKGSVKCKKCAKLLSYKDTSGSTSNMIKHLKTVHSVERTFKPPLQE
ncbi:Protein bric-a-brac 2 [Halotydeus destructor]|nr:Protein bric-a-brac 2 [Halotydeus destructor]